MKIVHVGRLQRAAGARKPGYMEAHQRVGRPVSFFGQAFLQLTDGDYARIRKEFALAGIQSVMAGTESAAGVTQKPRIGAAIRRKPQANQFPSAGAMAKNVAGAAGRVITAAASGQAIQASEETFQLRMKICSACEFLDKASQRCSKCGCFVSAKVIGKARLATEKCPVNKW